MERIRNSVLLLLVIGVLTSAASGQATLSTGDPNTGSFGAKTDTNSLPFGGRLNLGYELQPGEDPENSLGVSFLKHLAEDQKNIWTTPARLQKTDVRWALPFTLFTSSLIASDSWLARQIPDQPSQLRTSRNISQFAVYSLVGATGASLLWGQVTRNDHLREAGLLSSESIINSLAVSFVLKGVTQRQRPLEGDGNGSFFSGGNSFPSLHSAAAWSAASVLAHEYPGPLTKFLAYGLASAVTVTRVTGKEHFASDALIGSALGWFIGRQVYRAHHDPELGGGAWGNFLKAENEKGPRNPANMGSPDVPNDSWVYPLFDRLSALGYVQSGYAGMRPWSRLECARLLEEAQEQLRYNGQGGEAEQIYDTLRREFSDETRRLNGDANLGFSVDSIYTRFTGILGTPVRDGYHFGQTIVNDYGRPNEEGFNNVTGLTAQAVAGPFSFYVQGEYQSAPGVASDPTPVLEAIAKQDGGLPLANGNSSISRFRLLSATAAVTFKNIQISFGKQSLWLGPGDTGPFLFSNNAEPIPMLRVTQVSPFRVPGISRILGPVRTEFFVGQLSGQHWVFSNDKLSGPNIDPQPFIHGSKVGFKPTPNLEFGLGYTVLFGGPGLPFTWHNFIRTFTSISAVAPGSAGDPGDRRATFDFSYRVPHLRKWLTVYADSFVEDEISPLGSTRPSMRMGMHLPQVPKLPKLELRMEGLYTDVPGQKPTGFLYWNGHYLSGYTNDGNLLGSWIGREGRGGQAWATYWLSPRSKFQFSYRHSESDREFLQGGHMNDFAVRGEHLLHPKLGISGFFQYEQWKFPLLASTRQSNVSLSLQLTFYPRWRATRQGEEHSTP
jgi:membrane-associated phospholipid phosphatase